MKLFKLFRSSDDRIRVGETIRFAIQAEHGIDGGFIFSVPHFLKPAAGKLFTCFRHVHLR